MKNIFFIFRAYLMNLQIGMSNEYINQKKALQNIENHQKIPNIWQKDNENLLQLKNDSS